MTDLNKLHATQIACRILNSARNAADPRKAATFALACADQDLNPGEALLRKAWALAYADCKAIGRRMPE